LDGGVGSEVDEDVSRQREKVELAGGGCVGGVGVMCAVVGVSRGTNVVRRPELAGLEEQPNQRRGLGG